METGANLVILDVNSVLIVLLIVLNVHITQEI